MRSNHRFSIVAVHGLGANPDYAWVWNPKNNPPNRPGYPSGWFNWLKELLPTELSCRVMTFNYDSKWLMNAPQQRLSNISDGLLDSLRNKRDEDKVGPTAYLELQALSNQLSRQSKDRPLIFIGHSFGGNVIEQVCSCLLLTSCSSHAEYSIGHRLCVPATLKLRDCRPIHCGSGLSGNASPRKPRCKLGYSNYVARPARVCYRR